VPKLGVTTYPDQRHSKPTYSGAFGISTRLRLEIGQTEQEFTDETPLPHQSACLRCLKPKHTRVSNGGTERLKRGSHHREGTQISLSVSVIEITCQAYYHIVRLQLEAPLRSKSLPLSYGVRRW
jgi:hypothetical protein